MSKKVSGLKQLFNPLPFFMLCLYIFFMYNAQATLLPTVIHSIVMYSMIIATFAYYLFKQNLNITIFSIWYLSFGLICFFSATFYIKSDIAILYTILISLVISYCYVKNIVTPKQIDTVANIYIISALVMAIQIWSSGQLDYLQAATDTEHSRLGSEITGNANVFSALLMYSGVFAAWSYVYSNKNRSKLIYAVSLILILVIMVISGGRKTIVGVVATLALFYFFKGDIKNKKRLICNILIAICVVGVLIYAVLNIPFLYDYVGKRFEGLFSMLSGKGAEVGGDDMRSKIFVMAYEGWMQNPFFGHGIDSFKGYNQSVTGHYYYAHNNYVELLYDVGIIGFVAYYWIFVYIYKHLKTLNKQFYKYKILGYGLLMEMLIFDFGGVSYYLVGNIVILAIAYKCSSLIKNSL